MVFNLDNFIIDVIIKVKFYNNSIKKKIIIFLVDTPQLIGIVPFGMGNMEKIIMQNEKDLDMNSFLL